MPPINVEMKLNGQAIRLPDITAGQSGSFTDARPEGTSILVVLCDPEDNGGVMYRQDPQKTTEVLGGVLRIVEPSNGREEMPIRKDETVTMDVYTKFGHGILTLKHY